MKAADKLLASRRLLVPGTEIVEQKRKADVAPPRDRDIPMPDGTFRLDVTRLAAAAAEERRKEDGELSMKAAREAARHANGGDNIDRIMRWFRGK
jgi:hypothetical protein